MARYTPSETTLLLLALAQQEENKKRAEALQGGDQNSKTGDSVSGLLELAGVGGGSGYLGSTALGTGGATSAAAVPAVLSAAPATQIAPAIPGLAAPAAAAEVGGGAATLGTGTAATGVAPVAGVAGVVAAPVIGSILLKQAAKRFFNKKGIPRSFQKEDVLTSKTLGRSIPGFEGLSPEDKVRLAEQGYKAGVVKFSGHNERMNKLSAEKQAEIAAKYRAAGLPEPTSDSTVNVRGDELLNLDRYRTNMNLAARYGGEDAGISKGIWERFKPEPKLNAYERATAPESVRAFLDELDRARIPKGGVAMGKPGVLGGVPKTGGPLTIPKMK